jgi:hypothetical protein
MRCDRVAYDSNSIAVIGAERSTCNDIRHAMRLGDTNASERHVLIAARVSGAAERRAVVAPAQ